MLAVEDKERTYMAQLAHCCNLPLHPFPLLIVDTRLDLDRDDLLRNGVACFIHVSEGATSDAPLANEPIELAVGHGGVCVLGFWIVLPRRPQFGVTGLGLLPGPQRRRKLGGWVTPDDGEDSFSRGDRVVNSKFDLCEASAAVHLPTVVG